jgi:hypothetical protein
MYATLKSLNLKKENRSARGRGDYREKTEAEKSTQTENSDDV